VQIDASGPPGSYHLSVGLYDWKTGDRLRVGDEDSVVIGRTP
jgi:hypothetical protein